MDLLALLLALARRHRPRPARGRRAHRRRCAPRCTTAELALAQARAGDADLALRRQGVDALVAPLAHAARSRSSGSCAGSRATAPRQLGELSAQVGQVREGSERLGRETAALVTALRRPQARGQWGELQLRRVVEHAGMLDRCDFDEQVSVRGDDGALRPDLVVRLPGDRCVVVDAKVTLAAYLEAARGRRRPGPGRAHRTRTPGTCASTSTGWPTRRTGARCRRRRSSSCCSCPARRSSGRRWRPTRRCSSTPTPGACTWRRRRRW